MNNKMTLVILCPGSLKMRPIVIPVYSDILRNPFYCGLIENKASSFR